MKNNIEDGIDQIIGKENLFTTNVRNQVYSRIQGIQKRKRVSMIMSNFKHLASIIMLVSVLGGITFLVVQEEKNQSSALEENNLTKGNTEISEESTNESTLPDLAIAELKNMEYEGSEEAIIQDLIKRPEIIPYKPVLGGEMSFRKDQIKVLSHEWVFAPFDDGHTGGFLLLEYTIEAGRITKWEVISKYLYGESQ